MISHFERLPVEVFDSITAFLDLSEFQTLRLASRRLHLLSLSTFRKKYFTKLITTLGSPSLDRLANVASHSHLAQLVTILEIRLLNHCDYKDLTKISRIGIFPPPKRFPRVSCIRSQDILRESTLYDDVLSNKQAKCIIESLARGFSGLKNLKILQFRAHQVEPLGWKTIAIPEGDGIFRSRCLRAVLDAIVKSGVRLDTLSMAKEKECVSLSKCANVPYPALQLPIEYIQRLGLSFVSLKSLTLSVISQHNGHHRLLGWENGLSRLISSAPNLRHLALSLDRKSQVSQYGAQTVRSLSDSVHLERLESFHLCNSTIHESDLAKFVKTHASTLQRLCFTTIGLLTGSWPLLIPTFKSVGNLCSLRLASIEGTGVPAQFRQRDRGHWKATLNVSKDVRTMADMLDDLATACDTESVATMYTSSQVG